VPGPAQRSAPKRFQESVTWPVSYSSEMVPFGEIKDARERAAVACFQSIFQLRISIPVSVIVDARAKAPSRLDQRDLDSGFGQNVSGDTASRPAPNDAYFKDLFRHRLAAILTLCTSAPSACGLIIARQPTSYRFVGRCDAGVFPRQSPGMPKNRPIRLVRHSIRSDRARASLPSEQNFLSSTQLVDSRCSRGTYRKTMRPWSVLRTFGMTYAIGLVSSETKEKRK
jgi:hypothetical protein